MSLKNNRSGQSGIFHNIMLVLLALIFLGTIVLIIFLPYNMLKSNQKTRQAIEEKGIKELQVVITDKEIVEDSDPDGGSSDYYVYFEGGRIESYTWYNRLNVGDTVTVYTIDGSRYEFSKDEFLHSDREINLAYILSNIVIAIIAGFLLAIFYNKYYENRALEQFKEKKFTSVVPYENIHSTFESDYDSINRFFLAHINSKKGKNLTTGDFVIGMLVLAQIISMIQTKTRAAVLIFVIFALLLAFRIYNKSKSSSARNAFNQAVSTGNYRTVTLRVARKYTTTTGSGEDEITHYYVELENGRNITNCLDLHNNVTVDSLIHFFVVGSDSYSTKQVVEKTPGTSTDYVLCETMVKCDVLEIH